MRVCDVSRSDEVVTAFVVIECEPDNVATLLGHVGESDFPIGKPVVIETGDAAAKAMRAQAWGALNTLTPSSLRQKDPAKVKAAKKAQATKASKAPQEATTAPTAPAAASGDSDSPNGPADAPAPTSGDTADV